MKTDSKGNKEWDKTFGGTGDERASSVQQTFDDGYILAISTSLSVNTGSSDARIVKTDSNGNIEWDNIFGGTGNDGASYVQQTTDGDYIFVGGTDSDAGSSDSATWLVKIDSKGTKKWDKTFEHSAPPATPTEKSSNTILIFGGAALLIGLVLRVGKSRRKEHKAPSPTPPSSKPDSDAKRSRDRCGADFELIRGLTDSTFEATEATKLLKKDPGKAAVMLHKIRIEQQELYKIHKNVLDKGASFPSKDTRLKEAKSIIQDAEVDLQDAIKKGMQIPQNVQRLLQDAQKEVDAGHIATAKEYASKCSEKVDAAVKDFMQRKAEQARKQRELEQLRKDASEQIKSAKNLLEKGKKLGIPTMQNAEYLLTTARSSFDAKKYATAKEDAQQCRDIIERRIEESEPDITPRLPSRMRYNNWEYHNIPLTNNGTAPVKNIKITFSNAVESGEWGPIPELNVGEQKNMRIHVRPTETGDVPIEYIIQFTDLQERTYETKHTTIVPISTEGAWKPEPPASEPVPSDQFTTLRTIWDPNPSNRDFVWSTGKPDEYGELPGIKQWIGDKNPNIYWFLLKIVNRADYPVTEWNVTLYTEQALMITKAHLDDKRVRIVDSSFDTNKNRNKYVVSIPPELGVSIPAKGGTRLMYFETDIRCEDALKMEFGVSGVVKLGTTPQIEVPIREKRFTYACKYGDFKKMFYGSVDALASQVMANLQDSYRREIVQNFTNSFRLIRDFENYCKDIYAEPEILIDKLEAVYSSLKAAEPITKDEILPFVEENLDVIRKLGGAAPNVEAQKERGMRMCERLIGLLHQVKMEG